MNYDKKLVKHYANLCEITKRKASELSATSFDLITAFCLYFKNAKKPAYNAEKIVDNIKGGFLAENFSVRTSEDLLKTSSALYALVNYKLATSSNEYDSFASKLFTILLQGASDALNSDNALMFYSGLSCLNAISSYDSLNRSNLGENFYLLCKQKLANKNPIADNAPCDLLLLCAIGAFYYEKQLKYDLCESIFESICYNALSINFAIGKSLLSPQVSSPSATALALKLCTILYRHSGKEVYRFMLRRIWFNGMQFCQRPNGGVGYDSFVLNGQTLGVISYEQEELSPIYSEGLSLYCKHPELFCEKDGEVVKDSFGRYFIDDKMFARDVSGFFGKDLIEIPSLTSFDKETALQLKLKLNF